MPIDVYAHDLREAHALANRAGRVFLCELNQSDDGTWVVRLHAARATEHPADVGGSTTTAIALVERWLAEVGRLTARAVVDGKKVVVHAAQNTPQPAA